jgi:Tfp pilus assembly protein PilX
MKRLRRFLANEDGIAMATVVGMVVVLTVLSVALIDQVTSESNRAARAVTSDAVFQAAEAGINDYIAKLTDDSQYYDHCVAKGESTRQRADTLALVAHSTGASSCLPDGASAWTSGVRWTYPNGKDWYTAGIGDASVNTTAVRGYAYNLMITPPYAAVGTTPGTTYIDVVSTGCKVVDPAATPLQCDTTVPQRTVEVRVRRTTPADFQYMMTNMGHGSTDVCWQSTIYGRMYSTGDIYVCGATFYGNVMAEGLVRVASGYPAPNVVSPGRIYDDNHPDIRTVLKNPLSFSDLLASVSQVQSNALLNPPPTTAFDDPAAKAWRINFSSNGNVEVWECFNSSAPEANQPYCGPDAKLNMTSLPTSSTTFTLNVTGDTSGFTPSGAVYVGPNASGRIDTVSYTGVTSNSFTGAKCTTCSGSQSHRSGVDTVSMVSGGISGQVPAYNGPIPANGAIYTGQDAIISWPTTINGYHETSADGSQTSKLNGRVTVASNQDIIVAGDVHYASEPLANGIGGADDDVLGLIAQGSVWLARYAPANLWWRAATMAVDGSWGDYACKNGPDRGDNSYMTFVGTSTYGSNAGCIHSTGGYNIDHTYRITDDGTAPACPSTAPGCKNFDALKWLIPPWFPPLNGIETVLFREVPPSYTPPAAPAP